MVISIRLAVGGAHRSQLMLGAGFNFIPCPAQIQMNDENENHFHFSGRV
jgi:hypothetical protein